MREQARHTESAVDLVHVHHATQTSKPSTLLLSSCCPARLNPRSINLRNGWVRQLSLPLRNQTACRSARPDGPRLLTSSSSLNSPGLYRRNNVPHWQRVHQTHDGLRQWQKGPRAKMMLYPYYALLASTSAATMYMMGRMVLVRPILYATQSSYTTSLTRHNRATRLGSPATRRLPTVHCRNRAPSRQVQNTHNQAASFRLSAFLQLLSIIPRSFSHSVAVCMCKCRCPKSLLAPIGPS